MGVLNAEDLAGKRLIPISNSLGQGCLLSSLSAVEITSSLHLRWFNVSYRTCAEYISFCSYI